MLALPKHIPVSYRHVACFHSLVLPHPPHFILKPLCSWAGKSSESGHVPPRWLDFIQHCAHEKTLPDTATSVLSRVPLERGRSQGCAGCAQGLGGGLRRCSLLDPVLKPCGTALPSPGLPCTRAAFSQWKRGQDSFVSPGSLSLPGWAGACEPPGFASWGGGYSAEPWCWALDGITQQ